MEEKSVRFWRLLKTWPETNLKQTAQSVIPDDPEASAYRFIIVAAKRARQLQNGARSFLPPPRRSPPWRRWKKCAAAWCSTTIPLAHRTKPGAARRMAAVTDSAVRCIET